jgi:NAD(P)H-flavin reductase
MDNHASDPMLPLLYGVHRRVQENDDSFTLELEPVNGETLPPFRAGQFNMLYMYGVGEVPISICGDPGEPHRLVHTTRSVGTVTRALSELRENDVLGVRGPYGTDWPLDELEGRDIVIVAGGIGLAPIRPVILQVLSEREKFGRFVLMYGARTQGEMLYRRELEQWRSRFDMDVYVTVDRATGNWHGNVGVVTTLIRHAPFDPLDCAALVCGPEIMMRFTMPELRQRGVALERTYVSMERNMKCGVGFCGHCQMGSHFICKHGPVIRFDQIQSIFGKREV